MLRSDSTPASLVALALSLALLLNAACGGDDLRGAPAGEEAAGALSPLYLKGGCQVCHGPALAGTHLGPGLGELAADWDQESLVEYLIDPQGVTDRTPRLRERRALYAMRMPPARQAGLSREEVEALAAWLLSENRRP